MARPIAYSIVTLVTVVRPVLEVLGGDLMTMRDCDDGNDASSTLATRGFPGNYTPAVPQQSARGDRMYETLLVERAREDPASVILRQRTSLISIDAPSGHLLERSLMEARSMEARSAGSSRWRGRIILVASVIAAALPGCSNPEDTYGIDDCSFRVSRNRMGLVDCSKPACARTPACQPDCGNGARDPGEECDDGNRIDGDTCEANCTLPFCGNGIKDTEEDCDDGNGIDGDTCEANCTLPFCGNGIKDTEEDCDDGNGIDGDDCEANCTLPFCGNGIKDTEEDCDDGNGIDGDDCEANCTLPFCGNGIRDLREACDDGNFANGDGCDSSCVRQGIQHWFGGAVRYGRRAVRGRFHAGRGRDRRVERGDRDRWR
jgi:cysteine-rich repeat protein